MDPVAPIDPAVRLAIAGWPDDAPRGAVSTFCAEHGISRAWFYKLRERAKVEGQAAVLEPMSRRPKTTPTSLADEVKKHAVAVRAALEASGLDHGPVSVHEKMKSMRLATVPSVTSLARIFREAGVARLEPRKKPRAAWRRFVYPAPNACWQLDGTEYVLTGGRTCVIFQLIDDHSRLAVASHVADGETAEGAIAVFDKAVAVHGVPQRLLSDNGIALNPTRRGITGQLVEHVERLGVQAITGKPYKPTTQGKNERFHQTLFRYLDKQPLAATIAELQAQVDQFDRIYNTERPHQALPGRITPARAWNATEVAAPPRPRAVRTSAAIRAVSQVKPKPRRQRKPATPHAAPNRRVYSNGAIRFEGTDYQIGRDHAKKQVLIAADAETIIVTDMHGEILAELPRAAAGTKYVGNGKAASHRYAFTSAGACDLVCVLRSDGTLNLDGVRYAIGIKYALLEVHVRIEGTLITVRTMDGQFVIDHRRPAPGIKTVSAAGRRRGNPTLPPRTEASPMS